MARRRQKSLQSNRAAEVSLEADNIMNGLGKKPEKCGASESISSSNSLCIKTKNTLAHFIFLK